MKKLKLLALMAITASFFMLSACADDGDGGSNVTPTPTPTDRCVYVDNTTGYDNISGVWEIFNRHGLANFSDEVNNGDNDLSATLVCDIDLLGDVNNQWEPIINGGYLGYTDYQGTFDGDNHTISGIYIDDASRSYIGLFGLIGDNGIVKNVHITNAYISGHDYVGALSGNNGGTVLSSSVTNSELIINLDETFSGYLGGLAGSGSGTIVATYADNITLTSTSSNNIIGGISGYNNGDIIASYTNNITLDTPSTRIGGIAGSSLVALDTNFFVNDDASLMGIGDFRYNSINAPSNDNATPVSIQGLNDNVNAMNTVIGEFEGANTGITVDMRWQPGSDGGNDLPTLRLN